MGSKAGSVYKIDTDPSITTTNMTEITQNTDSKIYDMCQAPTDFYFLTDKAIFKSSYDSGIVNKLISSEGQTNIINYDENKMECTYVRMPERNELNADINEALIVEFYNK